VAPGITHRKDGQDPGRAGRAVERDAAAAKELRLRDEAQAAVEEREAEAEAGG